MLFLDDSGVMFRNHSLGIRNLSVAASASSGRCWLADKLCAIPQRQFHGNTRVADLDQAVCLVTLEELEHTLMWAARILAVAPRRLMSIFLGGYTS